VEDISRELEAAQDGEQRLVLLYEVGVGVSMCV
jgi:hypothetical protein